MLDKRLQGCLLLLLFLLTKASGGSLPETISGSGGAVAPAPPDSSEVAASSGGKRRSLATGSGVFCVVRQGADAAALQTGLNWACGQGRADCSAIQPGGVCFKENNMTALASYAYNDYYHRNLASGATCSFGGTAMTTNQDPSSGQCIFAGSSMAGGGTPAANAPSGLSPPAFTPPFGNGSSFGGSPTGALIPIDGAESLLSGARQTLLVLLLLALPLFFLFF